MLYLSMQPRFGWQTCLAADSLDWPLFWFIRPKFPHVGNRVSGKNSTPQSFLFLNLRFLKIILHKLSFQRHFFPFLLVSVLYQLVCLLYFVFQYIFLFCFVWYCMHLSIYVAPIYNLYAHFFFFIHNSAFLVSLLLLLLSHHFFRIALPQAVPSHPSCPSSYGEFLYYFIKSESTVSESNVKKKIEKGPLR
jgi:hypothetical protein